jgi:hypothetical protein
MDQVGLTFRLCHHNYKDVGQPHAAVHGSTNTTQAGAASCTQQLYLAAWVYGAMPWLHSTAVMAGRAHSIPVSVHCQVLCNELERAPGVTLVQRVLLLAAGCFVFLS